jgi:hypothetical protein
VNRTQSQQTSSEFHQEFTQCHRQIPKKHEIFSENSIEIREKNSNDKKEDENLNFPDSPTHSRVLQNAHHSTKG